MVALCMQGREREALLPALSCMHSQAASVCMTMKGTPDGRRRILGRRQLLAAEALLAAVLVRWRRTGRKQALCLHAHLMRGPITSWQASSTLQLPVRARKVCLQSAQMCCGGHQVPYNPAAQHLLHCLLQSHAGITRTIHAPVPRQRACTLCLSIFEILQSALASSRTNVEDVAHKTMGDLGGRCRPSRILGRRSRR
jgi:hypothetical protein